MNQHDAFSDSYAQARAKFLAAAAGAGLAVRSYPHPLPGRDGEALATDVVLDGPANAERLLIVTSACHGVEGFCGSGVQVDALGSAVFSNWIPFRRQLRQLGLDQQNSIIVNLEGTKLVDHSVMEGLHQLQSDFVRAGLTLDIVGLDSHHSLSKHPFATRRRRA